MTTTLYLNLREITEVQEKKVYLSDVADLYCDDPHILSKCKAIRVLTIREDKNRRYVEHALDVIQKIVQLDSSLEVCSIGAVDYIIDYRKPALPHIWWQWMKTLGVCVVSFFGAAFAIMTFNNDVSVTQVFQEIYRLVMGTESSGFTILETSYSVGLALGIIVFFNHFATRKLNTDPTPIEVEMRLYEENIVKTLVQNDARKESEVDVT